jgi:hypothetical protein
MSRSSVRIVTGSGLESQGSIPGRDNTFFHSVRTVSGPTQSPIQLVLGQGDFVGGKATEA